MRKYISVFFSGTGFGIDEQHYLAAKLYSHVDEARDQIAIGFNGCEVDYGCRGMLFGTGLDQQCSSVISKVMEQIKAGHTVTLNIYGHSRGGIAALMLAKQLSHVDPASLEINLGLLDPVPGNLVTTSTLDPFKISLANKTMDLTDCTPLRSVLALYPYQPLPSIACHAPLFPDYPEQSKVEVEVIPGCHAAAEAIGSRPESRIAALRFYQFFKKRGTKFSSSLYFCDIGASALDDEGNINFLLQKSYRKANQRFGSDGVIRSGHSSSGVILKAKQGEYSFFNKHHAELARGEQNVARLRATIELNSGVISCLVRAAQHYYRLYFALKWGVIGLGITSAVLLSIGLAAVPLIGAAVFASLSVSASLAVGAAVLGSASALAWYSFIKPVGNYLASAFFYPYYRMVDDITGHQSVKESDRLEAQRLLVPGC